MITVDNLRFTYPGAKQEVLTGMTFSVGEGEIFGFLGPSGAGKSTTQKILTGILKEYTGSVRVLGGEIRAQTRDYYEHIGVVMEFPNFYGKFTAMENLKSFASLYKGPLENAEQLMERLELSQDMDTRVSGYSKGMKIRLNFIRALLHRPQILFLDEPTTGIDVASAERYWISNRIARQDDDGHPGRYVHFGPGDGFAHVGCISQHEQSGRAV